MSDFLGFQIYAYFARVGDHVKIGYSWCPSVRIQAIRSQARKGVLIAPVDLDLSMPVELLATFEIDRPCDERRLHDLFAADHAAGEWFHDSAAFRALLELVAADPAAALSDRSHA